MKGRLEINYESRTESIIEESVTNNIHNSYAEYVKYILIHRALPDLRDGLKPVQRKIIFALYKLKLLASTPPKKSARTVGEVIAKYHPHGDTSVYSSLVRMSQYWKMNYPLVDMQGNNGSIDGDNPAAMRYTEARLSEIASEFVVENIKYQKQEEFVSNFDNSEIEPSYLPTFVPLLLVNGQTGIASGYATEIPPHNLHEVLTALIYLAKNEKAQLSALLRIIKGPDFPTGGQYLQTDSLIDSYKLGKGKIVICSNFYVKYAARKNIITITNIPYGVQKGVLCRQLELIRLKTKVFGKDIIDVRDESDGKAIRIVIELKKRTNVDDIIKYFCLKTHFQINYNFNMIVIHNGRPLQIGLKELLKQHILQSAKVMKSKTTLLLNGWLQRQGLIKCLLVVVENIKEVLILIMNAKNRFDAKVALASRFKFSSDHADQVLELRLYRLSAFDIGKLHVEQKLLAKQIKTARAIVKNKQNLLAAVCQKYQEIMKFCKNTKARKTKNAVESIFANQISEQQQIYFCEQHDRRFIVVTNFANVYQSRKIVDPNKIIQLHRKLEKGEKIIAVNVIVESKKPVFLIFGGGSIIIDNFKQLKTFNTWIRLNDLFKFDLYQNNIIAVIKSQSICDNSHLVIFTRHGQIKMMATTSLAILPGSIVTKFIKLKVNDLIQHVLLITNLAPEKYLFVAQNQGNCVLLNLNMISVTSIRSGTVTWIKAKQNNERFVIVSIVTDLKQKIRFITTQGKAITVVVGDFLVRNRPARGHNLFKTNKNILWVGIINSPIINYCVKGRRHLAICTGLELELLLSQIKISHRKPSWVEISTFMNHKQAKTKGQ